MRKKLLFLCFTGLLALLLLCSCGGSKDTPPADEISSSAALPPIDYTDGYVLIRTEKVGDDLLDAFKGVRAAIAEEYGEGPNLYDDFLLPGKEPAAKEILFGKTNRPETAQAIAECGFGSYCIRVINGKLVIVGSTDALTVEAAEYFIRNVIPAGKTLPADYFYTAKGNYPIKSITLLGEDISKYQIVYQNGYMKDAAAVLSDYLAQYYGLDIPAVAATSANVSAYEIVFGKCGRDGEDGKTRAYDDFSCYVNGKCIFFDGGSSHSAEAAAYSFLSDNFAEGGDISIPAKDGYLFDFVMPEREAYLENPDLFIPHWIGQWTPSEKLLSFDNKIECLMQDDPDHLFTVSHRGDFLFYPENSLEAMLSVWAMGGDCLEIDVHYTADNIPIIMHDDNLKRMTNYQDYAGKNGYPNSAKISDWTLEQLQVLRLKDGQGGSGAAMTPYRIPTLEEALIAAKGRFFIIFDKQSLWRYVDIPGLQPMSDERFLYPWMQKTGNFTSVLISYGTIDNTSAGTLDANEAVMIQKYIKDHAGADTYMFLRCWTTRSTVEPYAKALTANSLTNAGLLVNGAYSPNQSLLNTIADYRKRYPKALFGAWTIDNNGYDCAEVWETMYGAGYRSIMTNNMFALVQYAATKLK